MTVTTISERIFHQAAELAAGRERAAYLESVCGGDRTLRREIESLLSAHSRTENFLRRPSDQGLDPEKLMSDSLPGYELQELIGAGGMGVVYRARQISLRRHVAIKILPADLSRFESFRQGFEIEALAMAQLVHSNLVGIHDFGSVHGLMYLVMEFVEGNSLDQAAGGRMIDPRQAVEIVVGVASGLEHAHRQGILHRDIKPSNIFITPEFVAKLGDFGLAVPVDNVSSGMPMGTPGYLAPEVLEDFHSATPASDVYSLGLILHQLLTGVTPTRSEQPNLNLVPGLHGLPSLVREALAPQASERFTSGGEMKEGLLSWLAKSRRVQPRLLTGVSAPQAAYSPFRARPTRKIKTFRTNSGAMAAASIVLLVVATAAITLRLHVPHRNPVLAYTSPTPSFSPDPTLRNIAQIIPKENEAPEFDLDAHRRDTLAKLGELDRSRTILDASGPGRTSAGVDGPIAIERRYQTLYQTSRTTLVEAGVMSADSFPSSLDKWRRWLEEAPLHSHPSKPSSP